ncbi:peptide ABC transporter substrate-binding protein [Tepidibacillus sp. LV47]|uniref:peptide ABC transporter substrate-binding protein n=1 Tax=Tepidibacillus sp. LV47 TaxID=3398228 RepID=UPI003AABEEF0
MKKRFLALIVLVLLMVPVLSACGSTQTTSSSGKSEIKQEITLNLMSEPPTLDPALATDTTSGWVIEHLFEGLYTTNKNGEVVKGLAKDVKVSEDGKTYTFTIREDAKWSDGTPVTAQDFEYAWKRVLNPETASEFAFYLYYLKGAEAYNKGKGSADQVGVKAIDDHTLVVELEEPVGYFDKLLTFWVYFPVKKSLVESNKNWAAQANTLVSNGAYKLTSWEHDSKVVIEKNDQYYNKDEITMEKVTWVMINEATTYYQMYKGGQIDLIASIPSDAVPQEKSNPEFKIIPYFGTYMYMFNVKKEPFNNLKVRQAFNLAIDREAITKQVTQSGETPAYAFVPEGVKTPSGEDFRKQKEAYFKQDIEKAKQLIKEAMQEEGWTKFPEVTLIYNTSENHKKVAESIQNMLSKNLGINVKLENQEWKAYLARTNSSDFQMARMGWVGIFLDPAVILDYFLGDSPNNRTLWVNPKYDELLHKGKVEADQTKRMEYLHQAEDILMQDLPFMPIYFYSQNYLTSKKFEGIVYPYNRYPNVRWAKKIAE